MKINSGKRSFPRYVLNQLNIFVPVGNDINIVIPVKYALVSVSKYKYKYMLRYQDKYKITRHTHTHYNNKISIYDHKIETSLMGIEHLSIKIKEILKIKILQKNYYYNPLIL